MTIIESIREFMLQCPYLKDMVPVNVDYLGTDEIAYTIDGVPSVPVLQKYVDGSSLKQFNFVFGSLEYYGADHVQNIANSKVYENIELWFVKMTHEEKLPNLGDNRTAVFIETVSSGYMFGATADTARYQIQARLVYYEEE